MKPGSCKSKGRRLQHHVVKELLRAFPELSVDDVRSVSMGSPGEDVLMSTSARLLFPFSIECKNTEKINIWKAIEQSVRNAKSNESLVVFKRNNSDVYCTLKLSALLSAHSRLRDINAAATLLSLSTSRA